MNGYALEMNQICKSFSGVVVLNNVNFKLKQGEVHAIMGGNGAGKSTLMKILTGVYTNDGGSIKVNGKEVKFSSPNDSKNNGVTMIFQELSLVPTLTVAENIFLNQEPTKSGLIDYKTIKQKTKELLDSFEIDIDPDTVVSDLSVGYCQLIEITKALSRETKILVMDEPTASLSESETVILFNLVRRLKSKGVSIVYISHRMSEIFGIADALTVLRDGKDVMTKDCEHLNMEQVIEAMLGNKLEKAFEWVERDYKGDNSTILEVKSLSVGTSVQNVSFNLKKGEIIGIAGLMASGRTEILESIFGIRKITSGNIILEGKEIKINSVQDAIEKGFALVPEDRRRQGLVLEHTVKENLTLPILKKLKKYIFIDDKKSNDIVDKYIEQLNIKTDGGNKTIKLLSGGNQQKVVIAKWLVNSPKVLLLDEPTAGVDVAAKGEIIDIVRKFADTGNSVILVSSELSELLAACDRILVLKDGVLTKELNRKDIKSEEELQHAIQQN